MSNGKVILFGASSGGMVALETYKDDHDIVAFCDNDPVKWGKTLSGLPIIKPSEIPEDASVIIASAYVIEILQQLEKDGVPVLWEESMHFADRYDQHMHRYFEEYMDDSDEPILVYHMGKVGSTSIETLIRAQGKDYLSFTDLNVAAAERLSREAKARPIKMVSIVRDPVARDIASLFQLFPDTVSRNRALFEGVAQADITTTASAILKHSRDTAIRWFDEEFIPRTGIDVYARPFDPNGVAQRIRHGNIDLLLLKLERINEATDTIAEFLGADIPEIPKANVAAQKWYASLYEEFKANFRADDDYLRRMYESRYAKHFYSQEEIDRFMTKWKGAAGAA